MGRETSAASRKFVVVICKSSGFSPVPASRDDCSASRGICSVLAFRARKDSCRAEHTGVLILVF